MENNKNSTEIGTKTVSKNTNPKIINRNEDFYVRY